MIKNEKILGLVILGIILAATSVHAVQYSIQFEENKGRPMQMVEVFGNGTTRSYEVPVSIPHPVIIALYGILAALMKIGYALPFVLGGFSLYFGFIRYETGFDMAPEVFHYAIYWILGIISTPITFYISRQIVFWRRIPYIYIIAALISGIPLMLNENFGQ